MIVALALSLLVALELARRALEPECPKCESKSWAAHSTQLQCISCGWSNLAPVVAGTGVVDVQHELGLNR